MNKIFWGSLLLAATAGILYWALQGDIKSLNDVSSYKEGGGQINITPADAKEYRLLIGDQSFAFDLVDPEDAPVSIYDKVMLGYNIMEQTQLFASEYAGDKLTCNNCHFNGGNTFGGRNGGISLVGVQKKYPRYDEEVEKTINLAQRINYCFEKSMNGKALPEGSSSMDALLTYFNWIGTGVKDLPQWPWLGLKPLKVQNGDKNIGKAIYEKQCATCHGVDGNGTYSKTEGDDILNAPPVFGPSSFNAAAGMNTLKKAASFIFYNMPYQQPTLTEEQAANVAAYMVSQPHPQD